MIARGLLLLFVLAGLIYGFLYYFKDRDRKESLWITLKITISLALAAVVLFGLANLDKIV